MTYEEIIYELKRLADLALTIDTDLAEELSVLVSQYEPVKGECCG